ncbi:MAG: hypothetical protein HC839_01615 [Leptolyngbyaceae cyanobacterium RM2_2_21]|nr:hypothetical protein [Leptolyngbyaceae cyanobacterium RM2_2_21]
MELQALLNLPPLRYLAQDESRIGRKTETQRVITAKGVKPITKVEWPREAFWLYGVVEPLSGWQWTQTYTHLNHQSFQPFLDDLSRDLGDTVAVMQLERNPAHRAKALVWPENIIPLFQPPHCRELNPIERCWQHLKERWKGENFPSLEALKQRVEYELSQLTAQQVQSLTSFDFILDALLQAAF